MTPTEARRAVALIGVPARTLRSVRRMRPDDRIALFALALTIDEIRAVVERLAAAEVESRGLK
jgi:hypothetical protein